MKSYKEILKNIEVMEWPDRTAMQIALAVYCAADGEEYDETQFAGLCRVTRTVWDDMDNPNLQLIADCVCDCYFDLGWGYRSTGGETDEADGDGDPIILADEDFERLPKDKEDSIIDAVRCRMW